MGLDKGRMTKRAEFDIRWTEVEKAFRLCQRYSNPSMVNCTEVLLFIYEGHTKETS